VWLLGRDGGRLAPAAAELNDAATGVGLLDADDIPSHRQGIKRAFADADGFDVLVIAVGVLGTPGRARCRARRGDRPDARDLHRRRLAAPRMPSPAPALRQGHPRAALVNRARAPRASNPIYGAAKADLDALAQGLSDAITACGVRVFVVRPGFVKARMTANVKPVPLTTTPQVAASATVAAPRGHRGTIWVPGRPRLIFAIARRLPRVVCWRLPL
jgi:decaprenylphospho-beta-D-erythro-pentofuranosid-2-ulose 2-reductase